MKGLVERYLLDRLSKEELKELRQRLAEISDEELAQHLQRVWESYEEDLDISEEDIQRIKAKIGCELAPPMVLSDEPKVVRRNTSRKWLWAAAVILPILLLFNVYQWWQYADYEAGTISMATEHRERSRVTLPDGTTIRLNEHSRLRYNPSDFRSGERTLQFEGEAYFDVASDSSRPFILHQDKLTIRVLGTRFNLHAVGAESYVRIDLDEGRVALEVEGSAEPIYLNPREYAIYNKGSNTVEVKKSEYPGAASRWLSGELVFTDEPLSLVLSTVEQHYGTQLVYDKTRDNVLFTGTLPGDNLHEAIEIIRRAMNLNVEVTQ